MSSLAKTMALVALTGLFMGCDGGGGGDCDPPCGDAQECCEGVCVFTLSDPNNCGSCGNVCTSGACTASMCSAPVDSGPISDCRPECTADQRCCGTRCVSRGVPTNTDGRTNPSFENCNGCGIACDMERASSCSVPGGGAGTARCVCGEFNQCLAGEVCLLDSTSSTYGCVSLSSDVNNCGSIGNMCAEGEGCSAGVCVCGATGGRCEAGQACCGGACLDTSTDAENCGGCGQTCTPNAPQCVAGACTCAESGRACTAPTAGALGIGGDVGESCCPSVGCVANSDANCACEACPSGEECVAGGSGILGGIGGMGDDIATVCCGDSFQVSLLGCGGFGGIFGDGGIGFPIDGGFGLPIDAGIGLPIDSGTPAVDSGTGAVDSGVDGGAAMDAGVDAGVGMDGG